MLLVRARFRAPMGRLHKGNVHIDSGAGTAVDSYWQRILASKEERAYRLKVVGGERVQQSHSRIVTFWISAVRGGEEFKVETHETILSVPKLDQTRLNSTSSYLVSLRSRPQDFILCVHYTHLHAEEETGFEDVFEPAAKETKLRWHMAPNSSCPGPLLSPDAKRAMELIQKL